MQMFSLRDKTNPFIVINAIRLKYLFKRSAICGVDNQQFMLVELHFHRPRWMHHSNASAPVVKDEILEIPKHAFENESFNSFSCAGMYEVGMITVARFKNDITGISKRFQKRKENLKENFTAG